MENPVMLQNRYRLAVALTTLCALALVVPAAIGQVAVLPTISGGWGATAMALDPVTDDIMVVGAPYTGTGYGYAAASLTYAGAVNTAFGGGIVVNQMSIDGAENWPNACAIDSAGKLLSTGQFTYVSKKLVNWGFATARYNSNGALDKTFNKVGATTSDFSSYEAVAEAIVLQGSGTAQKVVVVGQNYEQNPILLARYTNSGSPDTTFGSSGVVSTTTPFSYVSVRDVAQQSDGSIVVCFWTENKSGAISAGLMRYTQNGVLDTTFGSNGYATLTVNGLNTYPQCVAVDAHDNIIVGGDFVSGANDTMYLARFTPEGALDGTFGNGGIVSESFATVTSAVTLDSSGNIVIAGVSPNTNNLVVARFTSAGNLDSTFGSSQGVFNGQGYANDFAYSPFQIKRSVQIQGDGHILAVGTNAAGANAVIRYNSNGTPDTTF
jgi:uncharacterized delta-60 repeat protein